MNAPAAFLRVLAGKLRGAGVPWMDAAAVLAANRETLDLDYLSRQARELRVDDLLGQLLA